MTPDKLFEALRRIAPNVRFSVHAEQDPSFEWDGDGPDPIERGLYPYDVIFACSVIVDGDIKDTESYLGGSYYEPDEPIGDAHGYLLDKLLEAAKELMNELEMGTLLRAQLSDAVTFLEKESRREYEEQVNNCRSMAKRIMAKMQPRKGEQTGLRGAGE
jgi:hypothetical protein